MSARTDLSNTVKVQLDLPPNANGDSPRSSISLSASSAEEGGVSLNGAIQVKPTNGCNMFEVLANVTLEDEADVSLFDPESIVRPMIPDADSPFWVRYGNKLRVNGTQEEVLLII